MSVIVIVMVHVRSFPFLSFPFGLLQPTAQPKHCYELDPSCSVSDMKKTNAGGRTLFYFELGWPSMASKDDGEEEGEGESGRCVRECDVFSIICIMSLGGSLRRLSVGQLHS